MYCKQHASLGEKEERVKDSEMRVDRCILVYTDLERPGRKMTRTIDPKLLRIMIGMWTCSVHVHVHTLHIIIHV